MASFVLGLMYDAVKFTCVQTYYGGRYLLYGKEQTLQEMQFELLQRRLDHIEDVLIQQQVREHEMREQQVREAVESMLTDLETRSNA